MRFLFTISLAALLLAACSPQPKPINYGEDGCDFCRMTIVDPRYAAELVTEKGKVYKFDAIECMINFKNEKHNMSFAFTLVSAFDSKELVEAEDCKYLRSQQLPSPMGMYITGFSESEKAEQFARKYGGQLYGWKELNIQFSQLPEIKPLSLK
ncbi:MAG: nitrous oxide reductase accessory protein NosL [Fulvivirga sp.]|nr:nitrous oxide reductase accessory protein NosL [Fulvivirga sp.]